jgi:cytochrome c-type biogenesis protein CcmH/NrfF
MLGYGPRMRRTKPNCAKLGLLFALLVGVWLLLQWSPALAAETPEEQANRTQDLSRTTMSPFCPGRTLDACPSEYATQWRKDIRQWVSEGVSTEEIRARLKQRTDHDLTGAPSTSLDGVMPFLVTALSLCLLVALLRILVRPEKKLAAAGEKAPPAAAGGSNPGAKDTAQPAKPLDERLDDELRSMDDG